jgi:hypothetical protein
MRALAKLLAVAVVSFLSFQSVHGRDDWIRDDRSYVGFVLETLDMSLTTWEVNRGLPGFVVEVNHKVIDSSMIFVVEMTNNDHLRKRIGKLQCTKVDRLNIYYAAEMETIDKYDRSLGFPHSFKEMIDSFAKFCSLVQK